MPQETLRPNGDQSVPDQWNRGDFQISDFYTQVDDNPPHDGFVTYVYQDPGVATPQYIIFSLSNTTQSGTIASVTLRVYAARMIGNGGQIEISLITTFGDIVLASSLEDLPASNDVFLEFTATSDPDDIIDTAWLDSSFVRISMYNETVPIVATEMAVTAIEVVVEYEVSGDGSASLSFSETVTFGDVWTVSGAGSSNGISWSDTVQFADTWAIARSDGAGSPDISTGRTDTSCRNCGSIAQITESLIFYADGFASPVTWDGVSSTATTVAGAKLLPYVAAHRDRVWLYGDEPYLTGTVQTVSGITQITFSTAPATSVLGKSIAISDVTFGDSGNCQATIIALNGVLATLSSAPNQSFPTANFIIFSGTAGATLQWSDENDHTTWTDAVLPIGRLDGDIPTGIASVSGFVMLFKRTKTYRFDYGFDPNDENDRALVVSSETRGLAAHKCCVVVEGTAYCMDQFAAKAGWWITRGGALFPIEIGGDIRDVTATGREYELDWTKSSCWFGVYDPITNAIWWFCTLLGESYPTVAFAYNRPSVEGGDEAGRWMIHKFDHPCIMGVTAMSNDGALRAYIVCADPDNHNQLYVASLSGSYGDMATSSASGTVRKKISNTVLDLGKHTEFHAGSRVEINGVRRTVESDDTVQVTFTASWDDTVVENKTWRAGWKPTATFKTIYISPDPPYALTTIDQCHALFLRDNEDAELRVELESDGNTSWFQILGGAVDSAGTFANYERLVSMNIGVSGYEVSVILQLSSPGGGDDMVHFVDIVRHKRTESSLGTSAEMP